MIDQDGASRNISGAFELGGNGGFIGIVAEVFAIWFIWGRKSLPRDYEIHQFVFG
jgi:hypothetical protein